MTNEEMFDDLKQFIDARFAQQDAEFDQRLDQKLEEKLDQKLEEKLEEKLSPIRKDIANLTDFVRGAIDTSNEVHGKQLDDHEVRISQLEQRAA